MAPFSPSKIGVGGLSMLAGSASKADDEENHEGVVLRSAGDMAVREDKSGVQGGLRHGGQLADGRKAPVAPAMAVVDAKQGGGIACIEAEVGASCRDGPATLRFGWLVWLRIGCRFRVTEGLWPSWPGSPKVGGLLVGVS